MNQLRRDPAALKTALRSARSVLIVCHGNIIRSPFAARLVAQALDGQSAVAVSSAGLEAKAGNPPHPTALRLATVQQVDLSRHTASRLASEQVAGSDVIFVMDIPQLVALRERFPDAQGKTFLLSCLAPAAPLEIGDPIGGDESVFQQCFDHISRAAEPISHMLSGSVPRQ